MDRSQYLELRASLVRPKRRFALALALGLNGVLAAGIAGIWICAAQSPLRFLSIPLLSVLMFRSFALMHEAVHGVASRTRFTNEAVGVVSGALCLLAYEPWKAAHLEHHLWSGNIDRDPVMAMVKVFPRWPGPLRATLSFGWRIWLPILSVLQHSVFFALSASYFARRPKTLLSGASVLAAPLLWGALFFLLPASISGGVVLPAIALYLLGTEIINAPHHLGLPQYGGDTKLPLWEQFRIARTCVYPRWLARFVVLNFNYHAEHHMFPDLAWYELPLAHEAVRVIFAHGYHEDPQFAWVLRNRRRALLAVITQREEGVTEKLAA
jgi:omega-6 fatty acid desaturase (delta-12 desaturase)